MIIYNGLFGLAPMPPLAALALPEVLTALMAGADLGPLTPEITDQSTPALYRQCIFGPGPSALLDATETFLQLLAADEGPEALPVDIEITTRNYDGLFIPDQAEITLDDPEEVPDLDDLIQQERNFNRFYGNTQLYVVQEDNMAIKIRTDIPDAWREGQEDFLTNMYIDEDDDLPEDDLNTLQNIVSNGINYRFRIRITIPEYTIPEYTIQMDLFRNRALVTVAVLEQIAHALVLVNLIDEFRRSTPVQSLLDYLRRNWALPFGMPFVTYLSTTARKMILYDDHLNFMHAEPDGVPNYITDFRARIDQRYPGNNLRPLILQEIDSMRLRHVSLIKRYIRLGIHEDRFWDLARMADRDGCRYRMVGLDVPPLEEEPVPEEAFFAG